MMLRKNFIQLVTFTTFIFIFSTFNSLSYAAECAYIKSTYCIWKKFEGGDKYYCLPGDYIWVDCNHFYPCNKPHISLLCPNSIINNVTEEECVPTEEEVRCKPKPTPTPPPTPTPTPSPTPVHCNDADPEGTEESNNCHTHSDTCPENWECKYDNRSPETCECKPKKQPPGPVGGGGAIGF